MEQLLYKVEEAARILRIGRPAVYNLMRSNQLRSVKIGSSRRIPGEALEEYVATLMEEVS